MIGDLMFIYQIDSSFFIWSIDHPCDVSDHSLLRQIANLLGVESDDLQKELTSKYSVVSGVGYEKYFPLEVCINQRDSIAKELYDRLFNWLVFELNKSIMPPKEVMTRIDMEKGKTHKTIGLLDIYGFEVFAKNGFE